MTNIAVLTWPEARLRLRAVLEKFMEDPPSTTSVKIPNPHHGQGQSTKLLWMIEYNADLYFGSTLLAGALFCVSCIALIDRESGGDLLNASAGKKVYRFDIVAASIIMMGALISLWLVRRSTSLRRSDCDIAKKRDVLRFLKTTKYSAQDERELAMKLGELPNLSGTALTDIYPVYRKLGKEASAVADWVRIPSLLLVEGDIIALQVGDMVPADSCFVDLPAIKLAKGDRLTLESFGEDEADVFAELPMGRTTISSQSDHLLTLCNRIRLVRVLETPLSEFLRRPAVEYKSSQAWRKLQAARGVFFVSSAAFLCLTAAILFLRPDMTKGDLSLVLSLPLVAALGVSPAVGPIFVFVLEVIGTARILTTVHPFANPESEDGDSNHAFPKSRLLLRYFVATSLSRLSLWSIVDTFQKCFPGSYNRRKNNNSRLVRVPPATLNLMEKLGVCTAFALVDDELACEASAIPQQLLIPSRNGLKLLDICPTYDESSDESDNETAGDNTHKSRPGGRSFEDFDSDDDSETEEGILRFHSTLRRKFLKPRVLKRKRQRRKRASNTEDDESSSGSDDSEFEVQFEDPRWWQHLPSLKCIGLSCLLVDESKPLVNEAKPLSGTTYLFDGYGLARRALIDIISHERKSYQLQALADCIGFSKEPNSFGSKGDISSFSEKLRVHILSKSLFRERLSMDAHERSSELSRWWGLVRPDCTSVIVKDSRSGGYQLLTVGDPHVVAKLCNEAWQGEISTILPLGADDRKTILESSRAWKLADLDVAAFSYSPLPLSLEERLVDGRLRSPVYLLDHSSPQSPPLLKDKSVSPEWSLVRNQIFLGMLGSLVVPRREIQGLLNVLNGAGVRFVFFSYRNMRRQKELASQMGIDVAWNCAISLRPLESGEADPHRMVSAYADWVTNAKLPHGVADVRKHLEEVDNVPLLVSLYTDVTKNTTKEMVDIFQDYNDTVIAVGLSHLPLNDGIFSAADIAVGIDVLTDGKAGSHLSHDMDNDRQPEESWTMIEAELELVSAICSHACAFRFRGVSSLSHLSAIIEQGRASLESVAAGVVFFLASSLSFSIYIVLTVCTPAATIPHVPIMGVVVFLQIVLPLIGFSMAFSDTPPNAMKQVPPKNDTKVTFGKQEGLKLYQTIVWKAVPPALFCQLLHVIAFGELILSFEADLVARQCGTADSWHKVIRCGALKDYSGPARISSGIIVFTVFVLTTIVLSATYIDRFEPLVQFFPWKRNHTWAPLVLTLIAGTVVTAVYSVDNRAGSSLPWYFYVLVIALPPSCMAWNEYLKKAEGRIEARAEKLRRLQFETRLGAWSPK